MSMLPMSMLPMSMLPMSMLPMSMLPMSMLPMSMLPMSMLPISRKTALLPLVAVASLTIAAAGPVRAADPAAGEADFKKICAKCHTIAADQAGKKKLDPPLHGVIGRKAGSVAGFRYSGAMTASNVVWSARTLDGWLTKPKDFIPKTRMPFGGWTQAERRANVIAYVREASK